MAALADTFPSYAGSCGGCFEVKCSNGNFRDGYGADLSRWVQSSWVGRGVAILFCMLHVCVQPCEERSCVLTQRNRGCSVATVPVPLISVRRQRVNLDTDMLQQGKVSRCISYCNRACAWPGMALIAKATPLVCLQGRHLQGWQRGDQGHGHLPLQLPQQLVQQQALVLRRHAAL